MNNMLSRFLLVLLFSSFGLYAVQALADCTGPGGTAGQQFYNTTYNVMQFCHGALWHLMAE